MEPGKKVAEPILFAIDENWLALQQEPILEPDLPIIDPHHHLWDRGSRYLFDELLRDARSGHDIHATVHVQCGSMYRADGDRALAPVGETEFVNGIAAMAASGHYGPARLCAGIVGFANLRVGATVERVLEAHCRASERFRGVRQSAVWDADKTIKSTPAEFPRGLMAEAKFREGVGRLAPLDLSFEAWIYHTQIPELADLAAAFPDTNIVLDHVGGPLGIGVYAQRRSEVFADWRRNIQDIAKRPNVNVKLGGLGMHVFGFGFDQSDRPASSDQLADAWRPYVETCIEAFGVGRCMFESNFPVDKRTCSYAVLWNAFKRIAAGSSAEEKATLFATTAARFYRLDQPQARIVA
ncbi:MAG: amidohydrolase family protein [Beijerinckiaceae bacterium]